MQNVSDRGFGMMLLGTGHRAAGPLGQSILGDVAAQEKLASEEPARLALAEEREAKTAEREARGKALASPAYAEAAGVLYRDITGKDLPVGTPGEMINPLLALAERRAAHAEATKARAGAGNAKRVLVDDKKAQAKAIADAIAVGEQPPDLKGLYGVNAPVRTELSKRGFDLSNAQADWYATVRHIATLNGPQQTRIRQAVDATNEQLTNIERLYEDWKRLGIASGVKVFNKLALKGAKNLPGEAGAAAQQLETQIDLLTGELGNVLMGGNTPTEHALKLARNALSADWNEETFKSSIKNLRRDLRIRSNSLKHSTPAGLSAGNLYPRTAPPEAPPSRRKVYDPETGTLKEAP